MEVATGDVHATIKEKADRIITDSREACFFLAGRLSTMADVNQCDARISSRDAYIMENSYTWCGTAACADTCMC